MNLLILIFILIIFSNNKMKQKNINKYTNMYINVDKVFIYADKNKNGKLSIKEMLNNFDTNGRTVSTRIFIASILNYEIKNKTKILVNNELSLDNFRKLSVSDLKLDLFDENKKDKNGNLEPINNYTRELLNESDKIILNNI